MRFRFTQQNNLDAMPISEVIISETSRHELCPLLAGLQYVFTTAEVNEKVYQILETKIMSNKKVTGRLGMSLWEILVLGSVRLNLNIDYDMLQDLANNHKTLRGILGVETKLVFGKEHKYHLTTIKENVGLLDDSTLKEISTEIVKAGHNLLKKNEKTTQKEEKIVLKIKTDSFPVAANVHFPTDLNLLWDGIQKSLSCLTIIKKTEDVKGWRKIDYKKSKLKSVYRKASEIHRKKGANYKERLEEAVTDYAKRSMELSSRLNKTIELLDIVIKEDSKSFSILSNLKYFLTLMDKHIDLLARRILKEEKIPHDEKLFSLFEQHVEWLTKGKLHGGVVLGHNVAITTDQFSFIIDHHVMVKEVDKQLAISIIERVLEMYSEGCYFESISFDRGFYSLCAKEALSKKIEKVIMPKPGSKSAKVEAEEAEENYVKLRKKHSAIESNINELRHSGADFVPDKGLDGFKDYIAMSVLAHNLKRLGTIIIAQKVEKKSSTKRVRQASAA